MQCIGYKSFPGNSQLVQFNMISIHIYIFYPGFFNVGLEFSEKKKHLLNVKGLMHKSYRTKWKRNYDKIRK